MSHWQQLKSVFVSSAEVRPAKMLKHGERRILVRSPQRMTEVYIWSAGMAYSKVCRIRDRSVQGARILLSEDIIKPKAREETFVLYFPSEEREISCELAWQNGRNLGVQFHGSYRPATRRYGADALKG